MGIPQSDIQPNSRSRWITVGVILILAVVVGSGPLITPRPVEDVELGGFSVDRAMTHVEHLSRVPHPMGTPQIAEVRDYIVSELEAIDLEPEFQVITAPDYFGGPGNSIEVVNVMARIPGENHTKAVLIMGHYDTVPTTPGANDNSAPVGVMLEMGRVLMGSEPLANDVILLFTDGEEPQPRFGSVAFVSTHPWALDVGFVVNLEAGGGSGPSMVVEERGRGSWAVEGLIDSAPNPVTFSFLTETTGLIGEIGTDFDSFEKADVPGLHFAYMRNAPIYHTMDDSFDNVDSRSVAHHGSNALAVARHFGTVDLAEPVDASDRVFFTVLRSTVVSYPASWAVPLAALAVALLGTLVVIGRKTDGLPFGEILGSSVRALGGLLVTIVVVVGLWWAITLVRSTPGVVEGYFYLVGLVMAMIGLRHLLGRRSAPKRTTADLMGVAVVWMVFALATAVWLAGWSYLFVWPLLAVFVVVVAGRGPRVSRRVGEAPLAVVAVVTLALMVPPIDTFFQMAMPRPGNPDSQIVAVIGASALLGYLAISLIGAVIAHIGVPESE